MTSPLEQFDILYMAPFVGLSNVVLFIVVITIILLLLLLLPINRLLINISYWYLIQERIYDFIINLIFGNCGLYGQKYVPFIYTLFLFLLISNLIGMIPYSFTITSHLSVTFTLAFFIFIGLNIIGLIKHKINFVNLFLPSGAPIAITPLLVIVEAISYIARVFSLAIRLFANMMSGHTLLKILAGFSWTLLLKSSIWVFISILPFIIVFLVTGLEIGIAILQAYVFTISICIYLTDIIKLH